MSSIESISVIFWNTLYRADPQEQLEHLLNIQDQYCTEGSGRVLFCLSEVTSKQSGDGFRELLEKKDFDVRYASTSKIKPSIFEGLAIVATRGVIESSEFTQLSTRRGVRNTKTRNLGTVMLSGDGVRVSTGHLSYPSPTEDEIRGVVEGSGQVFGGDLNTLANMQIVSELESSGMKKVVDPRNRKTFPIGPFGLELDHVFVDKELWHRSTVKVGDSGPSNHRPLILCVE